MKAKFLVSTSLIVPLLLVAALFFTSCTKEELPIPKEYKNKVVNQQALVSSNVQSVTTTSSKIVTSLIAPNFVMTCDLNFWVIGETQKVWVSVYLQTSTGLSLIGSTSSSWSTSGGIRFRSYPGQKYTFRIGYEKGDGFVPQMDIDVPITVTLPNSSIGVIMQVS